MSENEMLAMCYLVDKVVDIQMDCKLTTEEMKKCLFRLALNYVDQERSDQHGSV